MFKINLYDFIPIAIGYLLGAIPFGLVITRAFGAKDIRTIGSGNVGATNAVRAAGPLAGILVLVFDIGKAVAAVLIAGLIPNTSLNPIYLELLAGIGAVVGHIFPVYLGFKGGKGVNTALGLVLTILPFQALIGLVVFIITVTISKYISLGSILASSAFCLAVILTKLFDLAEVPSVYITVSCILVLLIVFAHRSNIGRLMNGVENKFSLSSKSSKEPQNV